MKAYKIGYRYSDDVFEKECESLQAFIAEAIKAKFCLLGINLNQTDPEFTDIVICELCGKIHPKTKENGWIVCECGVKFCGECGAYDLDFIDICPADETHSDEEWICLGEYHFKH